ncbi:FAD dependent oxidoreductase [Nocardioides sp. JS614]|nr:FAD dependent oxidoreductase [Nocardioides sp. JS614]
MSGSPRRPRVGVVGGGIVGAAVARELLARYDAEVVLWEKEDGLGRHQTGHNSGVVHAGVYYTPGSHKARLCVQGGRLLRAFCEERGLVYEECGKLIVATDEGQRSLLHDIERRGRSNGVTGLRWLEGEEIGSVEPHARGVAALHSPRTAIVDYGAVTRALGAEVVDRGGLLHVGTAVTGLQTRGREVVVTTSAGSQVVDLVVACAGLHADRVARMAGDDSEPMIVPFRGEYHVLRPDRSALVRGMIYPVPDPRYPFLGVHLTRHVDGSVSIGPNAVLALAREGYRWRDVAGRDLWEMARWPGFARLARRHWRTGVRELAGSASKRRFVAAARLYVPELRVADVERRVAGVRAQAVDRDGTLVDDFRIGRAGRVLSVRNAPSPAATSSLAIAAEVVAMLADDLPRRSGG